MGRGRPKKEDKYEYVGFRASVDRIDELEEISKMLNLSKSDLLRYALDNLVKEKMPLIENVKKFNQARNDEDPYDDYDFY